jgi:spore coat protein U-like protein
MRLRAAPNSRIASKISFVAVFVVSSGSAFAATATTTFQSQIVIQAQCIIISASTLDFGTQGVLSANVDQTSTIAVQCTNTTPYNIGLDAGTGAGASVATRKMTSGGATVSYSLYTDAGRSTVWGNTVGTDTVSATGNGASQSTTVFGRVPVQTTPAPGTYNDTVTVTVTY